MSPARIAVLLMGMAALLVLGTWGWTEAANAVIRAPQYNPVLAVLAVYGVAFGILILGGAFMFLVGVYPKGPFIIFVKRFPKDDGQ